MHPQSIQIPNKQTENGTPDSDKSDYIQLPFGSNKLPSPADASYPSSEFCPHPSPEAGSIR
jgi:hypothetical protein